MSASLVGWVLCGLAAAIIGTAPARAGEELTFTHGLSYFGGLKYPETFGHFDWAVPDAPKGGTMRLSAVGRFDTFNPLIERGRQPVGIDNFGAVNYLYDRLLEGTADSPTEKYGRLAESVAVSADRTLIVFRLRREARFHDGVPVTAHDVKFTFDMIKEHGGASIRTILRDVVAAEVRGDHEIAFHIRPEAAGNLNLHFFVSALYALPRHHWAGRRFDATTMEAPLGSGPYRIREAKDGKFLVYERVRDYWGRDLPVNRGRFNFDVMSYDYYLDKHVQKESLKGDVFDVLLEDVAKDWASNYNIAEVESGLLVKELIPIQRPNGFPVAVVWNLRRPMFEDIRVREALWWLHDFEWQNRVLYHDFYLRADSYFTNTDFSHNGTLPSAAEVALLEAFRSEVPARVFTSRYQVPMTPATGFPRRQLARAHELLVEAGWLLVDGQRVHRDTGDRLTIHFMYAGDHLQRVGAPYLKLLERVGIAVTARTLEPSNYVSRLRRRKFDATILGHGGSYTPGVELRNNYSSLAADIDSSGNYGGIRDPVVDALIERVIAAPTREDTVAAARALDRVMLWNFYGVPGFYAPALRYIYWDRFSRPETTGAYRIGFPDTWWWDEEKAARTALRKRDMVQLAR